jgi:hypothetical protein
LSARADALWVELSGALLTCSLFGCHQPVVTAQAARPPPASATVQQVFVRIDSTSPGVALVRLGDDGGVECVAPCLREVTIQEGAQYELQAEGRLPTEAFAAFSKEDERMWLVHDGVAPGTKWGLGAATAGSGLVALGLLATGGALNTPSITDGAPALPVALGVSGLVLGAACAVFGVLTGVYSDSDYDFKDPSLPGFTFR